MKHILLFLLLGSPLHAQDFALAKLEASPRHHEWVSIPAGESPIHAFVAYPEISTKALTVIVIHENRGLTNWVRGFADDLAAAGKVVVMGFCWGGSQTFRFATSATGLEASIVFYGSAPSDTTSFAGISAPVFGFYAQNDQRINAGIPTVESAMKSYGKPFEAAIYPDSGHAFMRSGEDPAGIEGNKAARAAAMARLLALLEEL